jgi:5-methylcytosine-specific restriction endonuclease McrA
MMAVLGGPRRRDNLWAACRQCNALKSDRMEAIDPTTGTLVPLFNPRRQVWAEHFGWLEAGGAHRRAHADRSGDGGGTGA